MNWIVLTPAQAAKYKQYLITPWWGIDPIQTKGGQWVLREDQIAELEYFKTAKKLTLSKFKDNDMDVIADLKTINTVVELTKDDFQIEEIEEIKSVGKL